MTTYRASLPAVAFEAHTTDQRGHKIQHQGETVVISEPPPDKDPPEQQGKGLAFRQVIAPIVRTTINPGALSISLPEPRVNVRVERERSDRDVLLERVRAKLAELIGTVAIALVQAPDIGARLTTAELQSWIGAIEDRIDEWVRVTGTRPDMGKITFNINRGGTTTPPAA
jgi:hypothetical protein